MKKLFTLLCICALSLCSSCEEKEHPIWDYSPYNIYFMLEDAAGENLLDPDYQYNAYVDGVEVIVNNQVFKLEFKEQLDGVQTRYYMPFFYGAKVRIDKNGDYYTTVGEFDSSKDADQTFNVRWSDGSYDEITYSHRFETDKTGAPTLNQTKIWLNGKEVENGFKITHTL